MLNAIFNWFKNKNPTAQSQQPAALQEPAPYKVSEPAATTPIPLVVETQLVEPPVPTAVPTAEPVITTAAPVKKPAPARKPAAIKPAAKKPTVKKAVVKKPAARKKSTI
jgi:hypothetical protein